ncbi:MAG: hypothetical protein WCC69_01975 [Pirellulales bacterium]
MLPKRRVVRQGAVAMAARRASQLTTIFGTHAGTRALSVLLGCVLVTTGGAVAFGCPFCGVVGESLASRRDRAACVSVAEADGAAAADANGLLVQRFVMRQPLRGDCPAEGEAQSVVARVAAAVNGTALLFGDRPDADDAMSWSAIAANEGVIGYVAAIPPVHEPAGERLAWLARRLEHPDPVIAADAFIEFGLAPYEAVRSAAAAFDAKKLRAWVRDGAADQRRRGFYGLALGLVAAIRPAESSESIRVLREAIDAPADDFRAGFDGLLGGVLVAEGEPALAYLIGLGLLDPEARPVDQRHMLSALRFAWESLAETIPREAVADATCRLLAAPAVAADAAVDLARYRHWAAVNDVAALWERFGKDDPLVRRAVAGYLMACPSPEARRQLDALAAVDPERLREAVDAAALPAGR